MTLEELKRLDKPTITPSVAASVIGGDPHYIRVAARECPEVLGFPVIRIGSHTKIPRLAFIRFLEGTAGSTQTDTQEQI